MTPNEAKEILATYRPGSVDETDPVIAGALQAVEADEELRDWFQRHCAWQTAIRDKLREIPPPEDLRARILSGGKAVSLSPWLSPLLWAAAAAVILIGVVVSVRLSEPVSDRFENFRSRMVGLALRQYGMDVVTNRDDVVRQFMADSGAPADYVVPQALEQLSLTGGGALTWRSNPVSMICFDRGDHQMLFLFVVDRNVVREAPSEEPEMRKVSRLMTVSWSRGDRAYLLAGPEEEGFGEKYY